MDVHSGALRRWTGVATQLPGGRGRFRPGSAHRVSTPPAVLVAAR
ncbi:MAG: hypothetical protein ACRDSH_11725 [Pseudonocardiaceae bacterium]